MKLAELSAAYYLLSRYAATKSFAVMHRKRGFINDALKYEKKCDEIYKQIPDFARSW